MVISMAKLAECRKNAKKNKIINYCNSLFLPAAAAIIFSASSASAMDEAAMLKQMQQMQRQMQQMQQQMNAMKSELEKARSEQKTVAKMAEKINAQKIASTPESDVKITMSPAPKFETADGAYSFKIGGFGQVDAFTSVDDVRDHPDGTNIRRARLNASGTIAKNFKYKLENDFAGNASALTDVYLEYSALEPVTITLGQFKEPFGLDTLTSDLFTTFNERALTTAFSPDRRIGAMVSTYGNNNDIGAWSAAIGGFGSGSSSTASTDDEARDLTARLTLAPFSGKTKALHFGVAGSHRIPDASSDSYSVSSRAENQMTSAAADLAVNTGTISGVDNITLLGLEAAGVYGPFSLQGEYVKADVDRRTAADQQFDGYYVEASYFLTGESRNYQAKTGKFDRVTPKWAINPAEGNWGAWQLAARYSQLDLNDTVIRGGQVDDITLGLRWIPQSNVYITANYIISNTDSFATTANDDPKIWLLRTQFDF